MEYEKERGVTCSSFSLKEVRTEVHHPTYLGFRVWKFREGSPL